MTRRCVVLLSGGLDSTVLLAHLIDEGVNCLGLSIDYGQKHRRELEAAGAVSKHYKIPTYMVQLPSALMAGSALTGGSPVPHGHYADESMRATVVPARNTVLLATAAAVAVREGCTAVAYAAHAGDHAIYPDCRPEFAEAVRALLALCDYSPIGFLTPFISWSKGDVARRGNALKAPVEMTWSCYKGGEIHCGECGTCVERKEAFRTAGIQDPTKYRR